MVGWAVGPDAWVVERWLVIFLSFSVVIWALFFSSVVSALHQAFIQTIHPLAPPPSPTPPTQPPPKVQTHRSITTTPPTPHKFPIRQPPLPTARGRRIRQSPAQQPSPAKHVVHALQDPLPRPPPPLSHFPLAGAWRQQAQLFAACITHRNRLSRVGVGRQYLGHARSRGVT